MAVSPVVVDQAIALTQRHRLRAYDAVQLACALTLANALMAAGLAPLTFVAADHDLLIAAAAEGLTTLAPPAI